jgi:hypothetical protein
LKCSLQTAKIHHQGQNGLNVQNQILISYLEDLQCAILQLRILTHYLGLYLPLLHLFLWLVLLHWFQLFRMKMNFCCFKSLQTFSLQFLSIQVQLIIPFKAQRFWNFDAQVGQFISLGKTFGAFSIRIHALEYSHHHCQAHLFHLCCHQ